MVGAAQWGALRSTDDKIGQQLVDARVSQRAAVVIGGLKEETIRDKEGKLISISFTPIIINSGNTQTRDMEFVIVDPRTDRFRQGRTDPPDPAYFFNNTAASLIFRGKYVLGPKIEMPKVMPPMEINAKAFEGVVSGRIGHFYYGAIRYRNVFDENAWHITKYCFSINNFASNQSGFAMDGPIIKVEGGGIVPFYTICRHWNCTDDECKRDEAEYAKDFEAERAET